MLLRRDKVARCRVAISFHKCVSSESFGLNGRSRAYGLMGLGVELGCMGDSQLDGTRGRGMMKDRRY